MVKIPVFNTLLSYFIYVMRIQKTLRVFIKKNWYNINILLPYIYIWSTLSKCTSLMQRLSSHSTVLIDAYYYLPYPYRWKSVLRCYPSASYDCFYVDCRRHGSRLVGDYPVARYLFHLRHGWDGVDGVMHGIHLEAVSEDSWWRRNYTKLDEKV